MRPVALCTVLTTPIPARSATKSAVRSRYVSAVLVPSSVLALIAFKSASFNVTCTVKSLELDDEPPVTGTDMILLALESGRNVISVVVTPAPLTMSLKVRVTIPSSMSSV